MGDTTIRLAVAQKRFVTGDVDANLDISMRAAEEAAAQQIDILVFPELSLTGMVEPAAVPDLAIARDHEILHELAGLTKTGPSLVIGFIEAGSNHLFYNSQAYLENGEIQAVQRKIYLPGYGQFDESRSFASGESFGAFETKFGRAAMLICEDAWHTALPYAAIMDGAGLLFTSAASPEGGTSRDATSQELWTTVNRASAITLKCFNIFANRVGEDRHLNYWGGSHIISPSGRILTRGSTTEAQFVIAEVDLSQIALQRHNYRYVQDESLEFTIRQLQHIEKRRGRV